jgi:hypothetical protein
MTTPFDSSPTSAVNLASNDYRVDALIDWDLGWVYKWGGAVGTGATITYSFPTAGSVWEGGYGSGEENSGLGLFDLAEQAATRTALAAWSRVANITFVEVPDTASSVGDIRFARSSALGRDVAGVGYAPDLDAQGGDVWLASDYLLGNALSTPAGQQLLLHEIGHALGLKHPFEGPSPLPIAEDNYNYTVMSYTAAGPSFPTTPQPDDVLAITYLYGAKGSLNAGVPGNYFLDGSDGNDILSGLTGRDTIEGFGGNDALYGGGGDDFIDGGDGIDTAVFVGARSAYSVRGNVSSMTVSGPEGFDQLVNVERLQFTDKKIAFDLGAAQPAGETVRLIGAAFGAGFIPQLTGSGIALFDAGFSMTQIAQAAINTSLFQSQAGSPSNGAFVNAVYRNVTGHSPTTVELNALVGMLQGSGGTLTQADLLVVAANHPDNANHIGIVGLQQTGVEYV